MGRKAEGIAPPPSQDQQKYVLHSGVLGFLGQPDIAGLWAQTDAPLMRNQ